MKPRRRYYSLLTTGLVLLWSVGLLLHWVATSTRNSRLRADLKASEARVERLEQFQASAEREISRLREIGVSTNFSERAVPDRGEEIPFSPRPRQLGSGRTGAWYYSDVRMPSGQVRRYYTRTNSPPWALLALRDRVRNDIEDDGAGW